MESRPTLDGPAGKIGEDIEIDALIVALIQLSVFLFLCKGLN